MIKYICVIGQAERLHKKSNDKNICYHFDNENCRFYKIMKKKNIKCELMK